MQFMEKYNFLFMHLSSFSYVMNTCALHNIIYYKWPLLCIF